MDPESLGVLDAGAILEVLLKIRQRPGVFLGRPSASNLYLFVSGYSYARKETEPGDYDFLAGLNQWIHDRFGVTSTQGWAKIIEFHSMTEADELPLFWKLLDDYLRQKKSARRKVS
jgi:hypothetical protein